MGRGDRWSQVGPGKGTQREVTTLFVFLFNKPEGVTSPWSHRTVMKSSWKHNSASSESTWLWDKLQSFPHPEETTKSLVSDLFSKDLHWLLLSPRIAYTTYILLSPAPPACVIAPAFWPHALILQRLSQVSWHAKMVWVYSMLAILC